MALLRAELLKWKRSWVLWGLLLAAAAGPAFNALMFWGAQRVREASGQGWPALPWDGFFAQAALFSHLLVYPFAFGLVTTYAVVREFQEGTAANLFILPAGRLSLLAAKLAVTGLILAVAVVAAVPLTVAAGWPLIGHLPTGAELLQGLKVHLVTGVAQFLLVPATFWLAVLSRHYVVPLAAAAGAVLVNVFTTFAGEDSFWIPTALPAWTAQATHVPEIAAHVPPWWLELPPIAVFFLGLSALSVMRRDIL